MTADTAFELRLAAALRAPAPGDPPFPAERLCARLAGQGRDAPTARLKADQSVVARRRRGAAAAALVLVALGAGAAAVLYRPDPLHRNIPSISARDATFPELLDAVRAELQRIDPDPEATVSFRLELPEDRRAEDLPHVTITARNITALALLDTAAGLAGLKSRREGNMVVFVPKAEEAWGAIPEGAVVHYGNEWDRDPATRPPVLETREWMLPAGTAPPPPCTSIEWKRYFAAHGVDWPYGSSLAWNEALGILRIENAPEQLARVEEIVGAFLHAEGAEFEPHAECAEFESHAENAESAENPSPLQPHQP